MSRLCRPTVDITIPLVPLAQLITFITKASMLTVSILLNITILPLLRPICMMKTQCQIIPMLLTGPTATLLILIGRISIHHLLAFNLNRLCKKFLQSAGMLH